MYNTRFVSDNLLQRNLHAYDLKHIKYHFIEKVKYIG